MGIKHRKKPVEIVSTGTKQFKECDLNSKFVTDTFLHNRYVQLLIIFIIVGVILRFYNLGYNSLWLDEASTYEFAKGSFTDIWFITANGEFNPPLFHWIEHIMLTFGNSEFILRFVPAVCGVLVIPVIYQVGKEFIDRNVGIILAAAFSLSPFLIFYSQEARAYSMMLLMVALTMMFCLRGLRNGKMGNWVMFAVCAAIAYWTHFYAMVFIAGLVLYMIILFLPKIKENYKILIGTIGLFGIICAPILYLTFQLFAKRTAAAPTYGIQGLEVIVQTFSQVSGFSGTSMFIFGLLFVLGITHLYLFDKKKSLFLILMTVLIFIISLVLSYMLPMIPKYLIFLTIIFFMGIAFSYKILYMLSGSKWSVYGIIGIILLVNASFYIPYYTTYSKDNWKGLAVDLVNATNPGDIIVLLPGYIAQPLDYYYSSLKDNTTEVHAYTAKDLDAVMSSRGNNRVVYIMTPDIAAANPNGEVVKWIQKNTKSLGQNGNIQVYTN
jgi:mannosyltransferase